MVDDKTIRQMQAEAYQTAVEHGWLDSPDYNVGEKLSLIHSEISEALEESRNGKPNLYFSDTGKPEGFGVELADAVIRIFDLSEKMGIDLQEMLNVKMAYNKTRPYKHGGKKF